MMTGRPMLHRLAIDHAIHRMHRRIRPSNPLTQAMATMAAIACTLARGNDSHCVHRHELQVWPVPPIDRHTFHAALDKSAELLGPALHRLGKKETP